MGQDTGPESIASPAGHDYVCQILSKEITHPLHDYIIEGICTAASGKHLISVLPTGGGKTSYLYGLLKFLQIMAQDVSPVACPYKMAEVPQKPCMIVIFPTKGLEVEMEGTFRKQGLTALAINEDTVKQTPDIWLQARNASAVFLAPEQLKTVAFDDFVKDPNVASRVVSFAVDELHLILDWGGKGFREAYHAVGLAFARLQKGVVFIGLTATFPFNDEDILLRDILGLTPGSFSLVRRSNIRPDIAIKIRVLRHGLGGWDFPDLRWIAQEKRKTIIFCDSIALAFRLFVYLWYSLPATTTSSERQIRFRLYCSLFTPEHNELIRVSFIEDSEFQVIFATDALKVGNDFPNVADVIILNPANVNDIIQKGGRVGRMLGLVSNPRIIWYAIKSAVARAQALVDGQSGSSGNAKDDNDTSLSPDLARLLMAACITDFLNAYYRNPESDAACRCKTCASKPPRSEACVCSGPRCQPELPLPKLSRPRRMAPFGKLPRDQQLTATQKARVRSKLVKFRTALWQKAILKDAKMRYRPPSSYLPDTSINTIVDNFRHLTTHTVERLAISFSENKLLEPYRLSLAQKITELCQEFSRIAAPSESNDASRSGPSNNLDLGEESDREHGEDDNQAITAAAYRLLVPPVVPRLTIRIPPRGGLKRKADTPPQ